MTAKIDTKIVGYSVKKPQDTVVELEISVQKERIHEDIKRPEYLNGTTYKIKPVGSEHALYVTINDIVLNAGTDQESIHPFEIFINSKNPEHFPWVVALTRVMSAVFRKGGDVGFLVEELLSVFDPQGGYWKKGGVFVPSVVADIGIVLRKHLTKIGIIEQVGLDDTQREFVQAKREEFLARETAATGSSEFPDKAVLCQKCNVKASVLMDGCMTCLNCGDSKCG